MSIKSSIFGALFTLLLSSTCFAGMQGNMHMQHSGMDAKGKHISMKVFSQGTLYRMDMQSPGAKGGQVSYIINGDARYSVMHGQKKYMQLPPNKNESANPFMRGESRNIEAAKKEGYRVKKIGKEKVGGFVCTVYQISGGPKHEIKTGKAWFADALDGAMVKMDMTDKDGAHMKLWMTDLQKKKLAAHVFQPPAGYTPIKMPVMPSLGQKNMMQDMKKMQGMSAEDRQKAMRELQEKIKKQIEAMRQQSQ